MHNRNFQVLAINICLKLKDMSSSNIENLFKLKDEPSYSLLNSLHRQLA